jgi:Holliday junction resolvase RusA-like endonuclease
VGVQTPSSVAMLAATPLDELVMDLDMPLSVNKLYRRGRHGMVILSDEAKAYHEYVKRQLGDQYLHLLHQFPIGPEIVYGLSLSFFFEELENRGWFEYFTKGEKKGQRKAQTRFKIVDVDNRIKFLQDVITKTVGIPNDAQIFVAHQRKAKGKRDHVVVRLYVSDPSYFLQEEETCDDRL